MSFIQHVQTGSLTTIVNDPQDLLDNIKGWQSIVNMQVVPNNISIPAYVSRETRLPLNQALGIYENFKGITLNVNYLVNMAIADNKKDCVLRIKYRGEWLAFCYGILPLLDDLGVKVTFMTNQERNLFFKLEW